VKRHAALAVVVSIALIAAGIDMLIRHHYADGWWDIGLSLLAIVLAIASRYAPGRRGE
jgi:hypothetical protein